MPKLKDNVTLQVVLPADENYKKGTTKQALLAMSRERGTFTKSEWLAMAAEAYDADSFAWSKIAADGGSMKFAKAWFNEFFNKHKAFQPVPVDEPTQDS